MTLICINMNENNPVQFAIIAQLIGTAFKQKSFVLGKHWRWWLNNARYSYHGFYVVIRIWNWKQINWPQ